MKIIINETHEKSSTRLENNNCMINVVINTFVDEAGEVVHSFAFVARDELQIQISC